MPPESHRPKMLSQWFTPEALAIRLVEWAGRQPLHTRILEPSAGAGALVDAICDVYPMPEVDAVEIDPVHATPLRARYCDGSYAVRVHCDDYLRRQTPDRRYPLCVMNPPYEDGLDGAFIAKAMDECNVIVGLFRLNVLVSKSRYDLVWSRIGSDWELTGIALIAQRPSFLLAGRETDSPLSDFVALKLARRDPELPSRHARVEWWT